MNWVPDDKSKASKRDKPIDPFASSDERRAKVSGALIAWIVVAVLILLFVFQNTDSTNVSFTLFDFDAPLWIVMLIAVALGVLLDRIGSYLWARRKRAGASDNKK